MATISRMDNPWNDCWNSFTVPWKLTLMVGGMRSSCSATFTSDLHDVNHQNGHDQQDGQPLERLLEFLHRTLEVDADGGRYAQFLQRHFHVRSARCESPEWPRSAGWTTPGTIAGIPSPYPGS